LTQVDAILTQLSNRIGTAAQLAAMTGHEPSDSSFKRALARGVEEEVLLRASNGIYHPKFAAGGRGAAVELGIHEGTERSDAFRSMSAVAGMNIGTGNPEKVTTRRRRSDGTLAPALEHFGLRPKTER
jgi:hypothetical protein